MFRDEKVTPARPQAEAFARAILALITAEQNLAEAKARVPEYTAQYSEVDYYAEKQEQWNRAADTLWLLRNEVEESEAA